MRVSVGFSRPFSNVLLFSLMLFSDQSLVHAGPCQSYEAAYSLEEKLREGFSLDQAKESVIEQEYSDGSAACFSKIKQEIKQMPYAFPLVHRALYKTTRR